MQVARPTTAGAHRQLAGHRGLAGSGERCSLLMTNVLPDEVTVATQGVGESVERVAGHAVHPLDSGHLQRRNHDVRNCLGHWMLPRRLSSPVTSGIPTAISYDRRRPPRAQDVWPSRVGDRCATLRCRTEENYHESLPG